MHRACLVLGALVPVRAALAIRGSIQDRLRDTAAAGGPLPITASRMGCLADGLEHAYRVLGFDEASGGDEVFGQLVLARIIEPASKLDILVNPVQVIVPTFG
jgi:hypothetical protein